MAETRSIVVLTGAGISRESGLHTFRDADGIWATVKIEDVATPEAFARDPVRVQEFYNERRRGLMDNSVAPNPAHLALAEFEAAFAGDFLLVTQNIDDLHERAGSRNLIHMHGELAKARCGECGDVGEWRGDLFIDTACPACAQAGGMRPHVVWFGEMPFEMDRIYEALESCDLFVSIGTSGNVYPAAGFVQAARMAGACTVELNLEPSEGATLFEEGGLRPGRNRRARLVQRFRPEPMNEESLEQAMAAARACTICAEHLPLGPRPVFRVSRTARLMIAGQAPGTKVHDTGIPWNDRSGDRLRDWLGLDRESFYDESASPSCPPVSAIPAVMSAAATCRPGPNAPRCGTGASPPTCRISNSPCWPASTPRPTISAAAAATA